MPRMREYAKLNQEEERIVVGTATPEPPVRARAANAARHHLTAEHGWTDSEQD